MQVVRFPYLLCNLCAKGDNPPLRGLMQLRSAPFATIEYCSIPNPGEDVSNGMPLACCKWMTSFWSFWTKYISTVSKKGLEMPVNKNSICSSADVVLWSVRFTNWLWARIRKKFPFARILLKNCVPKRGLFTKAPILGAVPKHHPRWSVLVLQFTGSLSQCHWENLPLGLIPTANKEVV